MTRSLPRHCLRQAGPRGQRPVAPGPPCPPRAVPFSSIAFWPPGAGKEPPPPSACFSQGRPRPGASQCSDPAHLQQPSKTGIFPLQVESGVFPVKRVPKNPILRAPPPPTHTHRRCRHFPLRWPVAGWPAPARPGHRVCCPGAGGCKAPGAWLRPPPPSSVIFGVVACRWPEAIPEIGKLFSDFNH